MPSREIDLLMKLISGPGETEALEFKENNYDSEAIGKLISALSNSTALSGNPFAHIVFGVQDRSKTLVGTDLYLIESKIGNEELPNWLTNMINPKIDIRFLSFEHEGKKFNIIVVPCATNSPTKFKNQAYIKVGTATRNLSDFPEKERLIWAKHSMLEYEIAVSDNQIYLDEILNLLDIDVYFKLINRSGNYTLEEKVKFLTRDKILINFTGDTASITNMGALLLAKDLSNHPNITHKGLRVIKYDGKGRELALIDTIGRRGYLLSLEDLLKYVDSIVTVGEKYSGLYRVDEKPYPELIIREIIANASVHQDLEIKSKGPLIEIFNDRIEVSSPGKPLIEPLRFIDENIQRNRWLASIMRTARICEDRGVGFDRVVEICERHQLPSPEIQVRNMTTTVSIYKRKDFSEMKKEEKIMACYWHCCLRYVNRDSMTNASLRERLGISESNSSIASRIIDETKEAKLIKDFDPENKSRRHMKYVPVWAA